MTLYLDANAIVPLFVREAASERVAAVIGRLNVLPTISDFGAGEVSAVLSRLVRTGELSVLRAEQLLADFDAWRTEVPTLSTGPAIVADAETLVRRFELKLRLPDAIHLAFAARHDLMLFTDDLKLRHAASASGIRLCET